MAMSSCLPDSRTGAPAPIVLWRIGPTLYVEISHDPHHEAGSPQRPNVPATLFPALVDTWARENYVDSSLAQDLKLPFVEERPVSGTAGSHPANVYLAQIYIPAMDETISGEFYAIHLAEGGHHHRALIGREFLRGFVLHYDGRTGEVTISND